MTNVYNLFSSGAKQGTSFIQDGQGNTRYSYDQFDALTSQYANLLRSSGVKAGDRVMVQVEKSPESLLFYFACLRFGCIYLPLNTAYKVDELVYFVNDAEPTLILCDPKSEALFRKLSNANIYTLDNEGNINADLDDQAFDTADRLSDDVAVIIYTSGTTGRPKGAMISHGNIESNSKVLSASWGWQCNDVMLHALPIYHVHGLFVGSHLPVMNGSPIIFLNRFDAAAIVELLPTSTVYTVSYTHLTLPTNREV